jgi:Ser/Thr protein kinase RdoA (MazF antagonist)
MRLSAAARAELAALPDAFRFDAPFATFIHGDPCPDNCRYDHRGYRLIDFEFGQISHALLDGSYGRTFWPTCWCCHRLPERVWRAMEAAYRRELALGYPKAADDRVFGRAVVEALAFWTLEDLKRLPMVEAQDRPWGITTGRTRCLERLAGFAAAAAEFAVFPAFAADLVELRASLVKVWPETKPLPLYPAFR